MMEKYNPKGSQSMLDYFLNRYYLCRNLEQKFSEAELLKIISGHFDGLVNRGRISSRAQTAEEFISLLDELDTEVNFDVNP